MLEGGYTLPRVTPEVGAVCGSSARTDLCGGRSAMTVPTATVIRYRNRKRQVCEKSRLGLKQAAEKLGVGQERRTSGAKQAAEKPSIRGKRFSGEFQKEFRSSYFERVVKVDTKEACAGKTRSSRRCSAM